MQPQCQLGCDTKRPCGVWLGGTRQQGEHIIRCAAQPVPGDGPEAATACRGQSRNQAIPLLLSREIERCKSMDEIKGIARVVFHPGKAEEWKRLSEEAMEIVRTQDTGTLQYEIFLNADETEAVVYERYRDADAAVEHFANISHLMEPILATASVTGEVLGTPNARMKELLAGPGPRLFTPWIGLADQDGAEKE